MFRILRIIILLTILVIVAGNQWLTGSRLSSWDKPVWVTIYPLLAEPGDDIKRYAEGLEANAFRGIGQFLQQQARRYGHELETPVVIQVAEPLTAMPPPLPMETSGLKVALWSLKMRWWSWMNSAQDGLAPDDVKMFVLYQKRKAEIPLERSVGIQNGGYGIVNAIASRQMSERNRLVIAHELLHVLGASDKCCTSFTPTSLTAQTFGGACPTGLNAVTTQAGGIACQVLAGGHVVYMPKDCDPFADNANDACPSGTCGMDGYCQIQGGTGREVINYQNQAKNLHPELKANSDYHKFNEGLSDCTSSTNSDLCGAGVEDVFASQWWPQAQDGIAWRWVPGAAQGFENFADAKTLSPAEKYDVVFSNLSTNCADADQVTVAGKTFCPIKVKCGTNKCEDADGESVSCTGADAKFSRKLFHASSRDTPCSASHTQAITFRMVTTTNDEVEERHRPRVRAD